MEKLEDLPLEILSLILLFLSPRDLGRLSRTSTFFRDLSSAQVTELYSTDYIFEARQGKENLIHRCLQCGANHLLGDELVDVTYYSLFLPHLVKLKKLYPRLKRTNLLVQIDQIDPDLLQIEVGGLFISRSPLPAELDLLSCQKNLVWFVPLVFWRYWSPKNLIALILPKNRCQVEDTLEGFAKDYPLLQHLITSYQKVKEEIKDFDQEDSFEDSLIGFSHSL